MKRRLLGLTLGVLAAACGGSRSPDPAAPTPVVGEAEPIAPAPPSAELGPEPAASTPSTDAGSTEAGPDHAAVERLAFEQAKPVFDRYCTLCHSKGGKKAKPKILVHFDMTAYPFGGHHAGEIAAEVRKALGIGGGKPTMPLDDPGAVKGDELALVAAWADAFDRARAAGVGTDGAHGHDDHGAHKH